MVHKVYLLGVTIHCCGRSKSVSSSCDLPVVLMHTHTTPVTKWPRCTALTVLFTVFAAAYIAEDMPTEWTIIC